MVKYPYFKSKRISHAADNVKITSLKTSKTYSYS